MNLSAIKGVYYPLVKRDLRLGERGWLINPFRFLFVELNIFRFELSYGPAFHFCLLLNQFVSL